MPDPQAIDQRFMRLPAAWHLSTEEHAYA